MDHLFLISSITSKYIEHFYLKCMKQQLKNIFFLIYVLITQFAVVKREYHGQNLLIDNVYTSNLLQQA